MLQFFFTHIVDGIQQFNLCIYKQKYLIIKGNKLATLFWEQKQDNNNHDVHPNKVWS